MKEKNASKEGIAMVLTCFLDEMGIKEINPSKNGHLAPLLEMTCIPYKKSGGFLKEWEDGTKIYLHACRGILDSNPKMIEKYGNWVEKGRDTLEDEKAVAELFNAINKHFPDYTAERHNEVLRNTRKKLMEIS